LPRCLRTVTGAMKRQATTISDSRRPGDLRFAGPNASEHRARG
jgi:hypothetical protein